ncbi:MAG: hypothetical protein DMG41_04785 [Acidobacteria bacterium]|nr:MAG: hypothetical protein AUH13_12915 [Acidobacteria bacterium 13_2_20CM_58_27]PYT90339.1 MAG: hypothetical protein DMG41_04785 [Acidobacteriota bacterium]
MPISRFDVPFVDAQGGNALVGTRNPPQSERQGPLTKASDQIKTKCRLCVGDMVRRKCFEPGAPRVRTMTTKIGNIHG